MSNYTITTDFGAKDDLPSGNAAKVIKGSEFSAEFTNIKTAVNSKADLVSPTFTGNTALNGTTTFGPDGTSTFNGTVNFTKDVTFDTNTMFVDVSENKVGIGTTSPNTSLHVKDGDFRVEHTRPRIYLTDTNNNSDYSIINNNGDFSIYDDTNTVYRMYINSSGNVGIGTSSPANTLTVGGLESSAIYADATVGIKCNANHRGIILQENSGAEQWGIGVDADGSLKFYDSDSATPTVTFADISGYVGIGRTPTSHILETQGEIKLVSLGASEGIDAFNTNSVQWGIKSADETVGGVTFEVGNSEKMRIDSSGKVGIGTSSPSELLEVSSATGSTSIDPSVVRISTTTSAGTWDNNSLWGALQFYSADASDGGAKTHAQIGVNTAFSTGGVSDLTFSLAEASSGTLTERMRIDSSGKVGIGTGSPNEKLEIYEGNISVKSSETSQETPYYFMRTDSGQTADYVASIGMQANSASDWRGVITFNAKTSSAYNNSGVAERMRIDSSGNVLVGKTASSLNTTGIQLQNDGLIRATKSGADVLQLNRQSTDGAIANFYKDGSTVGSISVTSSATAYNTSSDERLKENITDSTDAGSKIDAIQIRQFDWKSDSSHQDYGVIAQELVEVAPEAVHQPEDSEEMMGVDYSKLVPMLIKEVQTLRNRVAQLENN